MGVLCAKQVTRPNSVWTAVYRRIHAQAYIARRDLRVWCQLKLSIPQLQPHWQLVNWRTGNYEWQ